MTFQVLNRLRKPAIGVGMFMSMVCTTTSHPNVAHAQNAFGATPRSVSPGVTGSPELQAENCMVKLIRNVRVPAEVDGRITDMKIVEVPMFKRAICWWSSTTRKPN